MKLRTHLLARAAAVLLAGPIAGSLANQLPGDVVSGRVTSITGGSTINIDGKIYRIKSGSVAANAARTISAGQLVDAQLNGPANSSATEVINIVTRAAR